MERRGKYIFGLDSTYDNVLIFDLDAEDPLKTILFDSEQWQINETATIINNTDIDKKLPRTGFDYLTKCAIP